MDQRISQILVIVLLLTSILAPFAALAPLMLFLLGAGLFWGIITIAKILISGCAY